MVQFARNAENNSSYRLFRYFYLIKGVVGLPMLLSTFSHYSFWHMAINMYVLHNICTPAVQKLGPEQFVAMYLISGVFGNFASHLYKVFLNQAGQSLGAVSIDYLKIHLRT